MPKKQLVLLQIKIELEPQEKKDILCWSIQEEISLSEWVTTLIRQKLVELENNSDRITGETDE